MTFSWLKNYMPRSLYGRAALILILPVVTLQLVVSIVFIQRHFEGVTEQLSAELARTVNYAVGYLPDDEVAEQLKLPIRKISADALPGRNQLRWYDLAGLIVVRELSAQVIGFERVIIPDNRVFTLYLRHEGQLYAIDLRRERASASNPHQLLVNMVFFGVLMTLIAFLYLRNQLRPITRLARAAEAFGRGRTVPYSPSGAIEVRAAGNAFLDMRARIERHIEQRTMMLSGVSHDLRTPLTRLRLGLSLLDDQDREPLEQDVEEMQGLIDAFLDFARWDAADAEVEPCNPHELIARIVKDAKRAGQEVTLMADDASAENTTTPVPLRPRAIRRAAENLIRNAGRYGNICHVSISITDKSLRIRVEDDGPGIPPEDRETALKPFVRLDPARNQDKGSGVGLGLAIAADIARAHGGVLRLGASEQLGGLRADIVIAI